MPNLRESVYIQGQLTIRRKLRKNVWESVGGTKEWMICENEGQGELRQTCGDMQKHIFRHCGNKDGNP